jgi:hypothetical protein
MSGVCGVHCLGLGLKRGPRGQIVRPACKRVARAPVDLGSGDLCKHKLTDRLNRLFRTVKSKQVCQHAGLDG